MSNTRKLWKKEEYESEIKRVAIALKNTTSWKLKKDYAKYLKRLSYEIQEFKKYKGENK